MMSDWLTLTIHNSGLSQRARKSSIVAYGIDQGVAYIVRSGNRVQVRQTEAELKAELENE